MSDQSRPIDALISDLNVPSTEPEPSTNGANGKPKDYNQLVTTALESLSPPVNKDEIERIIRTTLYENGFTNYVQGDIQTHRRNNNELIADLLEKSKETPKPKPPHAPSKSDPPPNSDTKQIDQLVNNATKSVGENAQRRQQSESQPKSTAEKTLAAAKDALDHEKEKANLGFSLDFVQISPVVLSDFQDLSKAGIITYLTMCGYADLPTKKYPNKRAKTKSRSREEWAEKIGVSRLTWLKIETQLEEKGLIEHDPINRSWKIPLEFKLPKSCRVGQ